MLSFVYGIILAIIAYGLVQVCRPGIALYRHLHAARATGLPFKVIPFPPGLFSFFAFQVLKRLGLMEPGTKLHKLLSMGRPDGYELHEEIGDVFLTVSPMGLTMIVADPKVATTVNGKRGVFPKPPNTGGRLIPSEHRGVTLILISNHQHLWPQCYQHGRRHLATSPTRDGACV